MNIFKRIKNDVQYAYYRKLRNKAFSEMKKHQDDADDSEWRKWAKIGLHCLDMCEKIKLH